MMVFWQNGYAGTSMSDLTDATNLTKPSLYAAYGNKEAMYCAALDCYLQHQSETVYATLQQDDRAALEIVADFLKASAKAATRPDRPAGCFIVSASSDACGGLLPAEADARIREINTMAKEMFVEFFETRLQSGADREPDARSLADYILVLQTGLVQMAVRGMDYSSLEQTTDIAIAGLSALHSVHGRL